MKHVITGTEDYYVDSKNLKQGKYKSYYRNGKIKEERCYKDGKLEGECTGYFLNGNPAVKCNFRNGGINKECKWYYGNGKLNIECCHKNNKLDGEYRSYYRNGNPLVKCHYKNGKWEGEYKKYYENGKLEEERFYKDGKEIKDPLEKFILIGEEK